MPGLPGAGCGTQGFLQLNPSPSRAVYQSYGSNCSGSMSKAHKLFNPCWEECNCATNIRWCDEMSPPIVVLPLQGSEDEGASF